jgi:hypothetical protein
MKTDQTQLHVRSCIACAGSRVSICDCEHMPWQEKGIFDSAGDTNNICDLESLFPYNHPNAA